VTAATTLVDSDHVHTQRPRHARFDFCNEASPFRFALKPPPLGEPTPLQNPFVARGTPPLPSGAPISPQPFRYGPRCPYSTLLPCLPERLHHLQNPQISTTLISTQWTTKCSGSHTEKTRHEGLHGDLDCLGESCDLWSQNEVMKVLDQVFPSSL
jgi:hypothetical protein